MKVLFFLLTFFLAVTVLAQNSNIVFEHLSIEDGLSQSSVKSIFQDTRGFMWFGTADGLNRYDGYNFKIYREDALDTLSISNNSINQITEDADGFIWVATANGLNKYDPLSEKFQRLRFFSLKEHPSYSEEIVSILTYTQKKEKVIWFSTSAGVYKYDVSKNKISFFEILGGNIRESGKRLFLYRDSNNDIWTYDYFTGLYKFNKTSNVFDVYFPDNFAREKKENWYSVIFEDSERNLWAGTIDGLTKINLNTGNIQRYKDQFDKAAGSIMKYSFITTIAEVDKDNLLIGSGGAGVFLFNKRNGTVQNFMPNHNDSRTISHNVIMRMYKDRSGIIWIGTNGYGIDKFNPHINRFNFVAQTNKGLASYSVRSLFEDRNGKIWIAGYFGLDQYDPKSRTYKSYYKVGNGKSPSHFEDVVYSYAEDKDEPKFLYLGTEGAGVYRFDFSAQSFKKIYPQESKVSKPVFTIVNALFDDGKGYLWIGTDHALVRMKKSTGETKEFRHNPNNSSTIGPDGVTYLFEDSKGNFWIGTDLGGMSLMDREKETFTNFRININNKTSISSNFIKCIYEDSKKNLWVATNNGLNKLLDITGKFKRYFVEDGLPNNFIYSILEDASGNLWMSTNQGISRFDPVNEDFKNYDIKDGLQSNEFNTYAFCKARNGTMYFGGIKGFNFFNPSGLIENKSKPPVIITDIMLFNKSVQIGKLPDGRTVLTGSITETREITLDYTDNVVTLMFASLDYSSTGKNRYRYKLVGFDKQWSSPSSKRSVTYTNLDPGEYTFHVIGSNNDGVWNITGASLHIIITPPFWHTWWFLILAALAATQSVYAIYRWRLKSIEKTNRFLELQVKQRTAELNNLNESLKTEVSERTSAEEELRLLNVKKDKFFSIIAHDLKSPFHGILGYAELLAEDYNHLSEEERITFINDIHNISKSTFRFLENLLEWSRIQTGRIEVEPKSINLNEEIFEVFNILFAFAIQKGISIINNIDQEIIVYADKNQLSLILRNLISNAIKFSNDKGRIIINAADCQTYVEITVCDDGVGITPDNLKKLFRIDTQYTSKGTKNEEGTGLGLLLCKEMIEINKGSIRAESEPGKGTKFIFTLPKEPAGN